MKRIVLFFICIFSFLSFLWSEQIWEIKAPDSLTVGAIFSAELLLPDADPDCSIGKEPQIVTPVYDTLLGLSLLDVKVVSDEQEVKLSHQFIFTAGGLISLPSLKFSYLDKNGSQKEIKSESYPFVVHTLLDSTTKDITDIRAPKSLYFGVLEYLFAFLGIAIVILLIKILLLFNRKKQADKEDMVEIDNRPAWQAGLQTLEEAEEKLKEGNLLEYFFKLSFALRIFLEKSHNISATQMTTDELRIYLKLTNLSEHNKIFEIFDYADLVKFAKYTGDYLLAEEYCKWTKELFLQAKSDIEELEKLKENLQDLNNAKEVKDV